MTAKEMLKDHKHLLHGYYVFEQEELQAFVNQLCKEQRELDARILDKVYLIQKKSFLKKAIINNIQPNVF